MTELIVLAVVVVIGLYLLFVHNLVAFVVFALVISMMPFVGTPVAAVPLSLLTCAGLWVGLATRRRDWPAPGAVEGLSLALVVVGTISALGHGFGESGLSDLVRWVAAVAVVYPLRALSARELATVARVFVAGCVVATLSGFAVLAGMGRSLGSLNPLGYEADDPALRAIRTSAGVTGRLIGPYVDPNVAGFMLTIGLVLAVAFLRGGWRVAASLLLLGGIVLTLSRSAWGSVAVAVVLVVLASRLGTRARTMVLAMSALGAVATLAVPAVRARLLDSFGSYDIGSAARWEALRDFPSDLAGQWWLGLGFGAPEFTDPEVASTTNYAAHAVLHTMLRTGVVSGLVFLALLVVVGVLAWRLLRSDDVAAVAVGAGTLGLLLVALQLDVPVVTAAPLTAVFSMLVAVVSHPALWRREDVTT